MNKISSIKDLEEKANLIRLSIIDMLNKAGSGHPGGSLSIADIIAVLYFNEMNHDPSRPHWENRDRMILSKGHACPALYAALAESGYFEKSELATLRRMGSRLQGHPGRDKKLPGIEVSTGSLGHGLSIANGVAIAGKMDKADFRVYCIMGDGEIEEGQIWEAAMTAPHYKLDNLCAIVDNNDLQIDGHVSEVMNPYPIDSKFESFGWNVININGHDIEAILNAFADAKKVTGKPTVIVAKTIKGKGVSFMENEACWHGKAPSGELTECAVDELKACLED
ncbi:transketolase [bacterium]|nr:transketolase [bacterium]